MWGAVLLQLKQKKSAEGRILHYILLLTDASQPIITRMFISFRTLSQQNTVQEVHCRIAGRYVLQSRPTSNLCSELSAKSAELNACRKCHSSFRPSDRLTLNAGSHAVQYLYRFSLSRSPFPSPKLPWVLCFIKRFKIIFTSSIPHIFWYYMCTNSQSNFEIYVLWKKKALNEGT